MKVQAQTRYLRVSPRKMNITAGLVRGRSVNAATQQLQFLPTKAAKHLLATLASAVANAKENHRLDPDGLKVAAITVGQGPRLKRFQPRAFGRANPIRKPTAHVTLWVEGEKTLATVTSAKPKKEGKKVTPTTSAEKKGAVATAAAVEGKASTPKQQPKTLLRRVFQRKSGSS